MIKDNSTISFRLPSEALLAIAENKAESQSYHDYCKQLVLNALGIDSPTLPLFNSDTFEDIIDRKVQLKVLEKTEQINYRLEILQKQVDELRSAATKKPTRTSKQAVNKDVNNDI